MEDKTKSIMLAMGMSAEAAVLLKMFFNDLSDEVRDKIGYTLFGSVTLGVCAIALYSSVRVFSDYARPFVLMRLLNAKNEYISEKSRRRYFEKLIKVHSQLNHEDQKQLCRLVQAYAPDMFEEYVDKLLDPFSKNSKAGSP